MAATAAVRACSSRGARLWSDEVSMSIEVLDEPSDGCDTDREAGAPDLLAQGGAGLAGHGGVRIVAFLPQLGTHTRHRTLTHILEIQTKRRSQLVVHTRNEQLAANRLAANARSNTSRQNTTTNRMSTRPSICFVSPFCSSFLSLLFSSLSAACLLVD